MQDLKENPVPKNYIVNVNAVWCLVRQIQNIGIKAAGGKISSFHRYWSTNQLYWKVNFIVACCEIYLFISFTGILDKTKFNNIGENKCIDIKTAIRVFYSSTADTVHQQNKNINTFKNKQNNAKPALQNMYKIIINSCNFCIYWF